MRAYKRNLPVVAGRYTDYELRMLAELGAGERQGMVDAVIIVPGGSAFLFGMARWVLVRRELLSLDQTVNRSWLRLQARVN